MLQSKEIVPMMSVPMSSQVGNLGIQSRNAPPDLPHLGHQMTGRMIDEVESLSFVVNHVLAVMPLMSSVLIPGGVLVTTPFLSVGNIGVGSIGMGVSLSLAQKAEESQSNGKRGSVVGIGSPKNMVGSEHVGSDIVEVDDTGTDIGPRLAQNNDVSQPSGKRASVIGIGIPMIELGTTHFGS